MRTHLSVDIQWLLMEASKKRTTSSRNKFAQLRWASGYSDLCKQCHEMELKWRTRFTSTGCDNILPDGWCWSHAD